MQYNTWIYLDLAPKIQQLEKTDTTCNSLHINPYFVNQQNRSTYAFDDILQSMQLKT